MHTLKEKLFQVLILALTLCSLNSFNAYTQEQRVTALDGRNMGIYQLSSTIQNIMGAEGIPGLSIAIINDNKIAYHEVFGVSNVKTEEKVTSQSMFEGASLSKPIFAYFVMKMVEKNLIDLDTPLYEYLPHPGIAPRIQGGL